MNITKGLACVALALALTGCANTKLKSTSLPKGVVIKPDVAIPNDVAIQYYIPTGQLESKFFLAQRGVWVELGKALTSGSRDAFTQYFSQAKPFMFNGKEAMGLLVDIDPDWKFEQGEATMTFKYTVYDASQKVLTKGESSHKTSIGDVAQTAAFYNVSLRASQLMLVDILNQLKPSAAKYNASLVAKNVSVENLANLEKPVSSGTGFFINKTGQVLTAAHVLDNCLITKAHFNNQTVPTEFVTKSTLLDLAVLNTKQPTEHFLSIREGNDLPLGEPIANVGFPLQGVLEGSANITRGNISSQTALKGSMGLIQFSAPIQPGSSGGPLVSDGGELLGMAVSTLNASNLIEKGIIPQNVNFALDRQYIAKFLHKHNVNFVESKPNFKADFRTGNAVALNSAVKLACYQ